MPDLWKMQSRRRRSARGWSPSFVDIDPRLSQPDSRRVVEVEDLGGGITKTTYLDAPLAEADATANHSPLVVLPWGVTITRNTNVDGGDRWATLRD